MGRYTVGKEEFDKEVAMPVSRADRRWFAVLLAVFMAVALSACGGGGGTPQMPEPPPMPPTAQETCETAGNVWVDGGCLTPAENTVRMTLASIAAADTAEDAQDAYNAVKGDVTATQGEMLQAAVDARIMAINLAARVDEQKMALSDAAGMIDTSDLSTQALVDAARAAIVTLRQALDNAVDVSDADKAMYMTQLTEATNDVDMAQGGIDTDTRRTNQMAALTSASGTLQTALAALSGATPTQALLDAANNALAALNTAIADGADLTNAEKATYVREAANAAAPIQMAQTAFDDAEDDAEKAANAAMAATAAKLYTGIAAQNGTPATTAAGTALSDGERAAAYNNSNVPSGNTPVTPVDTRIMVGIGTATPVSLTEDKKTMVAAHYGWAGKRYTAEPDDDGMYEAMVYSNVGEPTEGDKFGHDTETDGYEYDLDDGSTAGAEEGELVITGAVATATARIASPSFDQSAGTKEFELPTNMVRVSIPGSYHGVSGTYYCTPAASSTCAAQVAANGFTLGGTANADNAFTAGGGVWAFKPANPETRIMSTPDAIYASYGWWIHKSEGGSRFTASAFVDTRGDVPAAAALDALQGTATYIGGAAGKYALSSSTGGTNDAGHFTAKATLNADFSDNSITGTIDNFMGANGMSRPWSVELKEAAIAATGGITRAADDDTVWTIDDTAAAASGEWSGSLYDNGADGVPKVGTGTFYSTYGQDGKMVGAFGVNKQ